MLLLTVTPQPNPWCMFATSRNISAYRVDGWPDGDRLDSESVRADSRLPACTVHASRRGRIGGRRRASRRCPVAAVRRSPAGRQVIRQACLMVAPTRTASAGQCIFKFRDPDLQHFHMQHKELRRPFSMMSEGSKMLLHS